MTIVAEHDRKLEWESDDAKHRWIGLVVLRHAISVCNLLEHISHRVCLEVCGRINQVIVAWISPERFELGAAKADDRLLNALLLLNRHPDKADVVTASGLHHV